MKYHTHSYRRLDGKCCGDLKNADEKPCSKPCVQKFRICIEYYHAKVSLTDPKPYQGPCAFGVIDTMLWGTSDMTVSKQHLYSYNFHIKNSWPIYILIIIEAYDMTRQHSNQQAVIDRIAYKNTLKPTPEAKSGQKWHDITLPNGPSVYEFSIRLTCKEDYYGVSCDKYCKNSLGHYRCDESGSKICDHGWMGPDCNTTICKPGCHSVHGFCTKPGECSCTEGWKGPFCDECIKYPGCVNGACIDSPWTCYCHPNWGGQFCDKSLNYCFENNPCKNGGICENEPSQTNPYKCICPSGFEGKNCEIDHCVPNPCKKGTCLKSNEGFFCQCFFGWTGKHCDLDLSICDTSSCKNGGKCRKDEKGVLKCICKPGFRGSECHLSAICENSECKHAKHCLVRSNMNGEYDCICKNGWTGKFCDKEINECERNPCRNGGICKDSDNDFICQCKEGFKGKRCEVNVACEAKPCKNGGVCQETDNGFICKCKDDYSGKHCEIYKTGCSPNPCRNGAYCYTIEKDFYCQCNADFWGKHCEHPRPYCGREACSMAYDACSMPFKNSSSINQHICGQYGTCVSKGYKDFECKCMQGFDGKNCEKNINDCANIVCENGGICVDGINDYECLCDNGFHGKRCEEKIEYCTKNPCFNGGICKEKSTELFNDFTCECNPGWDGRLCHLLSHSNCADKPCLHEGECLTDSYGQFKCECKPGWIGSICQFRDSLSKPCSRNHLCQNGGVCINLGDNDYSCHCMDGFEGKHCEKNINECHPNPCFNGGKCIDLVNSFDCQCPSGFYGSHCQLNFDECIAHPCAYGSVCIDRIDDFECRCSEGRSGKLCDQVMNNKAPQPPSCIYHNRTFDSGQQWSYNCQNCRCDTGKITCKKESCGVWSCLVAKGKDDPFQCKDDEICEKYPFDETRCFVPPCVQKAKCKKRNSEISQYVVQWPLESDNQCRPNAIQKNNYCAQILLQFQKSNMPIGVTIDDVCDALKALPIVVSFKDKEEGQRLGISCEVNEASPSIINVAVSSQNDKMMFLKSTNSRRPFVHFLSDQIADNIIERVRKNYSILSGLLDIKVETLLLTSDNSDRSSFMKYLLIPLILIGIFIIGIIIWHHQKKMMDIKQKYSTKTKFNNNSQFQNVPQYPNVRASGPTTGLAPNQTQYMPFQGDKIHSQNIPTVWPQGRHVFA